MWVKLKYVILTNDSSKPVKWSESFMLPPTCCWKFPPALCPTLPWPPLSRGEKWEVVARSWYQPAGASTLSVQRRVALVLGWYSRVLFRAGKARAGYTYRTTSTFDSDCTSASQAEVGSSSDHLERKYSPCSYFYPEMRKAKFEFWIVQLLLFLQLDWYWYWRLCWYWSWCQYWC